jgi:hypothetical protein
MTGLILSGRQNRRDKRNGVPPNPRKNPKRKGDPNRPPPTAYYKVI